jgi:hypothetical protein
MTARADRLTDGAKMPDNADFVRSSYPASSLRVFVDALERLDYRMAPLLAEAGIHPADLDDPDARLPRSIWGQVFSRALEQRPMKNAGMRLATVTPFGAFPLIDYLIATSQNVGEALTRLGRYLRLAEARSVPDPHEEEDPIRVLLEGSDTPFSAEFTVTLNLLHFREETETGFRATYASFCHEPDDAAEMERVLGCQVHTGASWNGWALARDVWQLPLRRRDSVLSSLLQQQADEAIARLPPLEDYALDVRRVLAQRIGGDDTRIQAMLGRLARRRDHSSDALLSQVCRIDNWSTSHERTLRSAISATLASQSAKLRTCSVIRKLRPSTGRSDDGAMRDHRCSVSARGERRNRG